MTSMAFTGTVVGAKADFAKRVLRITISASLEENIDHKDQLGGWIVNEVPVDVSIRSLQPPLPGVTSVTLTALGKSVTVSGEGFSALTKGVQIDPTDPDNEEDPEDGESESGDG